MRGRDRDRHRHSDGKKESDIKADGQSRERGQGHKKKGRQMETEIGGRQEGGRLGTAIALQGADSRGSRLPLH